MFKGRLPVEYGEGRVAVKRSKQQNDADKLSRDVQQELRIFKMTLVRNEGRVTGVHPNLVKILGYCAKPEALVYEWVGGGDLKSILCDPQKLTTFPLHQRVQCFRGMACGLYALHHECAEPIRHKDIKPGNALLTEDYCNAKLADYGVAEV